MHIHHNKTVLPNESIDILSIEPCYHGTCFLAFISLGSYLSKRGVSHQPHTTNIFPHVSPYTILFKHNPDYRFFRVIGCLCFPLLRPYNTHKLQFRSLPCVFLGYCHTKKGYKCLHIPTNKIYVSRNVRFDETTFPFATATHPDSVQCNTTSPPTGSFTVLPLFNDKLFQPAPTLPQPTISAQQAPLHSTVALEPTSASSSARACTIPPPDAQQLSTTNPISPVPLPPVTPACLTPSSTTDPISSSQHQMVTRQKDNTRRPKRFPDHVTYLATKHTSSFFKFFLD